MCPTARELPVRSFRSKRFRLVLRTTPPVSTWNTVQSHRGAGVERNASFEVIYTAVEFQRAIGRGGRGVAAFAPVGRHEIIINTRLTEWYCAAKLIRKRGSRGTMGADSIELARGGARRRGLVRRSRERPPTQWGPSWRSDLRPPAPHHRCTAFAFGFARSIVC